MIGAQTSLWSDIYQRGGGVASIYSDAVSLWLLNETSGTRADSIGSNDLTDNNTVGYANLGPSGTVGDFTAANTEYLSGSGTTVAADSNVTVAAWVRTTGAGSPAIFADGSGNFLLRLASGVVNLLGRGYADNHNYGSAINDGNWHFVVAYHDADNNLWGVSIDGGSASTNATGGANGAIGSITVGKDPVGGYWDDQIGPVGVWTRVLDAEVSSLYNSGKGKSYSDLTTAEKVGLVSYWDLDEASGDRADSHGSNDLTDNNTVTSATNSYPANLPGRVASFVAANSESLSGIGVPELTAPFTFSIWIKSNQGGARSSFVQNQDSDGSLPLGFGLETDVSAAGDVLISTDNSDYGNRQSVNSGLVTTDGTTWVHLLVSQEVGQAIHLYVNNVDEALGLPFTGTIGIGDHFYLGRRVDASRYYNGAMSSVAVWPRVLTADERTELYNSGDGAPLP